MVCYDSNKKSSLDVRKGTFRFVLAIILTFRMLGCILDVKSAFSHGEFENDENICVEAPEGFI